MLKTIRFLGAECECDLVYLLSAFFHAAVRSQYRICDLGCWAVCHHGSIGAAITIVPISRSSLCDEGNAAAADRNSIQCMGISSIVRVLCLMPRLKITSPRAFESASASVVDPHTTKV